MPKIITAFLFVLIALFPAASSADYVGSGSPKDTGFQLVPCDGVDIPCDFNALLTLFNRIISFILYVSIPLAAISFSYAGYLYLSAAGNASQIEEAHGIFIKVLWGFVFVLSAWLIVYTISKALLSSEFLNSRSNFLKSKSDLDSGGREGAANDNNEIDKI